MHIRRETTPHLDRTSSAPDPQRKQTDAPPSHGFSPVDSLHIAARDELHTRLLNLVDKPRETVIATLNQMTQELTGPKGKTLTLDQLASLSRARESVPHANDWRGIHYFLSWLSGGDYHQVVKANRDFKAALEEAQDKAANAARADQRIDQEEEQALKTRSIAQTFGKTTGEVEHIVASVDDLNRRFGALPTRTSDSHGAMQELQSIGARVQELLGELDPNGSLQRALILSRRGNAAPITKIQQGMPADAWQLVARLDRMAQAVHDRMPTYEKQNRSQRP
jgi:hypothetical protein